MKQTTLMAATAVLCLGQALAAPIVTHPAGNVTELASSGGTFTTYNGLAKSGNSLYFGNEAEVRSYDLGAGTESVFSTIGAAADNTAMAVVGSDLFMARTLSFSSPFPSNLGVVDGSGFTATLSSGALVGETTYAIYDAATLGSDYYFVANVGSVSNASPLSGATSGTRILRYDAGNPGSPIEIVNVGGYSGGLTFDAAGNLYYASQSGDGVLKFDAADVALGNLTAADGTTVVNVTAGSLDFLSTGELVAGTGFGQSLDGYDVLTGAKTLSIATTSGAEYMGKFVVGEDDTIYVTSTDYGPYASSLSAIAIPEPGTVTLMMFGFAGMLFARRKRHYFLKR